MTHAVRFAFLSAFTLTLSGLAHAQEASPLRLQGGHPSGARTSVTEAWSTLRFSVVNPSDTPRLARIVAYFKGTSDAQYACDLWVPAKTVSNTWLPVGPAPAQVDERTGRKIEMGRDVIFLLFDRTNGTDAIVLPTTEEKVRSRGVIYRKREPTTIVMVDRAKELGEKEPAAVLDSNARETIQLAYVFRSIGALSPLISVVQEHVIPPMAEAYDGVDHFILATNRIGNDPAGLRALRHWVQAGGYLWIQLDQVDPTTVARVLGEDLDFDVVDRVGLTTFEIHRNRDSSVAVPAREFERPVDFVRVLPGKIDTVVHTVNGWPASMARPFGRGRIVFTTLGPRGWQQPAAANQSPQMGAPGQPGKGPIGKGPPLTKPKEQPAGQPFLIRRDTNPEDLGPVIALEELASDLRPMSKPHPFSVEDLRPLLTEEIGYSVVSRSTAALILGMFVLGLVALAIGLRRTSRPEMVGWIGPAVAILAASVFLFLGQSSRNAVPATVASADVIDAVPGNGEVAAGGLFAFYTPTSGPIRLATTIGGTLDLDMEGLDGQVRRRVQTDMDAWHWDSLEVPAGVRSGAYRTTARPGSLTAVARFGASGIEGKLSVPGYKNPEDAVIATVGKQAAAVQLKADGSFLITPQDTLAPGQFISAPTLSDRQQRHQTVYRQFLVAPLPRHLDNRNLFMVWGEPERVPFTTVDGARTVGTSLLVVPLEFERAEPNTPINVPSGFVSMMRINEGDGKAIQPTLESNGSVQMRLRFQLPPSVLPMQVEKATLVLRGQVPGWRLTMQGEGENGSKIPLGTFDSPVDPVRIEITDAKVLQSDATGGVYVHLGITPVPGETKSDTKWKIDPPALEVSGRAGVGK